MRRLSLSLFFVVLALLSLTARLSAADLPVAQTSSISGITFDDPPLQLPVQQNFQMAMITASGEVGRSCGNIESFGWRMKRSEQGRVNTIFNSMIDHLRALGYTINTHAPSSVAQDITIYTADRKDKNLLFMWSAGEVGLVLVLCETSAPAPTSFAQLSADKNSHVLTPIEPKVITGERRSNDLHMTSMVDGLHRQLAGLGAEPAQKDRIGKLEAAETSSVKRLVKSMKDNAFSPAGTWEGKYICAQGETGATLSITKVSGARFDGVFKFYSTEKNPRIPSGSYKVSGEYDPETFRILINPGEWIQRPRNYYNTIIVGSFDPKTNHFTGFFEGVTGCTSLEASLTNKNVTKVPPRSKKKAHHAKTKKNVKKAQTIGEKIESLGGSPGFLFFGFHPLSDGSSINLPPVSSPSAK